MELTTPLTESHRRVLEAEIELLRERLQDAESTLEAISGGLVDAVVVADPIAERQVMLLEDARRGARLPIDRLRQGAITVGATGEILHANTVFGALIGVEPQRLFGRQIVEIVSSTDHTLLAAMLGDRAPSSLAVLGLASPTGVELRVRVASIPLLERPWDVPDRDGRARQRRGRGRRHGASDQTRRDRRGRRRGERGRPAGVAARRSGPPLSRARRAYAATAP